MEAKEIVAKEVARQAKFGMEPSWEDFAIAGQQAGIREVVEWVNEYLLGGEYPPWQAKLKEWGIRLCARCGAIRADNIDSDICGSCADDLRMEKEAHSGQADSDTGTD